MDGIYRGYTYNSWGSWVQARRGVDSPLDITLSGSFDSDTRTGELDISIYAEGMIEWDGLRVRIALTEDSLYYAAPNGTLWHNYTMRDMIPTASGTVLSINQGETVELSQAFSAPAPLDLAHCKLVVWVQADQSNYEVLQAARVHVLDLIPISVDDEAELPVSFQLAQNYPNPFNATTIINYSLDNSSDVKLAVYDLAGREVAQLFNGIQPAGDHQITWDGVGDNGKTVASGVYFYRLQAEGKNLTKRMMLLK